MMGDTTRAEFLGVLYARGVRLAIAAYVHGGEEPCAECYEDAGAGTIDGASEASERRWRTAEGRRALKAQAARNLGRGMEAER